MSVVDEVKQRLDIAEVVSGYVALTPAGRNLKARCPFHSERTPSFIVTPERQTWHCFGACATGGDVITFVMRAENLEFPQALQLLAQQAGVTLPSRSRNPDKVRISPLLQINEEATRFFHQQLLAPEGARAMNYLKSRGVTQEAAVTFTLGWSPPTGDALKRHLAAQGLSEDLMLQAGLLHRSAEGRVRDLFRGRLLFPIRDGEGRCVGFGGRSLDDTPPKYLNTPQTAIFNKSQLLYALDTATETIQLGEVAVVVEGYMDALMAHQHGFHNVVASMGTALTERQVGLLLGLAKRVVLALDPDAAGQEATLNSLETSWNIFQPPPQRSSSQRPGASFSHRPRVNLRVAILPLGMDPDLLIRQNPQEWAQAVASAQELPDFLLTVLPQRYDLSKPAERLALAERMGSLILTLEEAGQQDKYLARLEELVGVNRRTLGEVLGLSRRALLQPTQARRPPRVEGYVAPFSRKGGDPLEEYILALLFQNPSLKGSWDSVEEVATSFTREENRELFTYWAACSTIQELRDAVDTSLHDHLNALLIHPLPPADLKERHEALAQCLRRLEERRLRDLKAQEGILLSSVGGAGEEEAGLMAEALKRNRRLRHLMAGSQKEYPYGEK